MKLLMYADETTERPKPGMVFEKADGEYVLDITKTLGETALTLEILIREERLDQLNDLNQLDFRRVNGVPIQNVTVLPPLERPGKILCVGLNYRDHVLEGGRELPEFPTIFTKASTALLGHGGTIQLSDFSQQIDFEAELALVIGRKAKQVKREDAMNFVAAYTIMNDITARDYQKRSSQWTVGKSFDTFAPLGPFLITRDEIPDPHTLDIKAHLNGIEMQHSNTCQLIFDIPFLIEDLSAVMTLEPGDIISTGTPGGVGVYRNPPIFLQDGDVIEITISRIGTLSNFCRKQSLM